MKKNRQSSISVVLTFQLTESETLQFEEYGDSSDSVLSPLGDVAPEERTTASSSFRSNTTPEMENRIQPKE